MATLWAKMDSFLPVNPKAFDAGFWGTTIFMHLLLINKAHGCNGLIPSQYVKPEYLARYLQLDRAAAAGTLGTDGDAVPSRGRDATITEIAIGVVRLGLREASDSKLITLSNLGVSIVGWDEDWANEPVSSTERSRKWRESKSSKAKSKGTKGDVPGTDGDGGRPGDERDAIREEESRSDQSRVDSERVDSNPPQPDKATAEPKPKAKPKAETVQDLLLKAHGEIAGELWDLQEMLRASVIPRSRPLKPTGERLARVCSLLDGGVVDQDDCEAVLRRIAGQVKADPTQGRHFNGVTNWRPKNFDQTLGSVGTESESVNVGQVEPMGEGYSAGGKIDIK